MINRKIVLKFPRQVVEHPIIYKLAKDFELEFNILKANISPDEEGLLIVELKGKKENFEKGIKYLENFYISIQPFNRNIIRNENKCTHCGACVTLCPVDAFIVDKKTRKIIFDSKKCIACELCISACPVRAMELHF